MISELDIVWFPQQHLCLFVTSFLRGAYQRNAREHSMKPLKEIVVTKDPAHIQSISTEADVLPLKFFEDIQV